jgi:voltage-gated potassium channel
MTGESREHKTELWLVSRGPVARLRRLGQRVPKRVRYWFPHVPLSLAVALAGLLLLWSKFGIEWRGLVANFPRGLLTFSLSSLPFLLIGLALLLMSVGLLFRSRFSWIVAIVLTVATVLILLRYPHGIHPLLIYYDGILLVLLLVAHGFFNRSSLAAGTLFAITSSLMLLIYAVFGSLYLGSEFSPPIKDYMTAFYYSIVTMSTVGYGDIVPKTAHARLFSVSIIILGIAVFATSISAIVGPVVTRSVEQIMRGKEQRMKRANHFIIVGSTPLAFNTYRELKKRNQPVTLILRETPTEGEFEDADIVIGDPNDREILIKAGAEEAQAVLAMRADDSDNAFTALAVKELNGKAKTIVAVNDSKHLQRVRLVQPDFIIAPQVLGGEMLAMVLSGETITNEFVTERFLHFDRPAPPKGSGR